MTSRSTDNRLLNLEHVLGNPTQPGTFSYETVLNFDNAGHPNPEGEEILMSWGANDEFVPRSLGGRWGSTRELVERLMPVFRRDPSLALSFGLTSLMSGVNVWTAGSPEQKAKVAKTLLNKGRIAIGFHELAHGNDFLHNEFRLETSDNVGSQLVGSKEVINNIERAEQVLFMARSSELDGARSHTLVLTEQHDLDKNGTFQNRYTTSGMRTVLLNGIHLDGMNVKEEAIIGRRGEAVETALRAFQVTRAVLPAFAVGTLDASLYFAVEYASDRKLYGGRVLDLPHARDLIASAFADLVIADIFANAAVRSLHVDPNASGLLSAACKALVPDVLEDGLSALSVLFGSTFYGRVSPYGIIEKFVRDLRVLPIGHAGGTSCILAVLGALPRWARGKIPDTNRDLFDDNACGDLDFKTLRLSLGGPDPLTPWLSDSATKETIARVTPDCAEVLTSLEKRWNELRSEITEQPLTSFSVTANNDIFEMAREATLLMATGAVIGQWATSEAREEPASLVWFELCIRRLAYRLGLGAPEPPAAIRESAVERLIKNFEQHRSMRLSNEPIFPQEHTTLT